MKRTGKILAVLAVGAVLALAAGQAMAQKGGTMGNGPFQGMGAWATGTQGGMMSGPCRGMGAWATGTQGGVMGNGPCRGMMGTQSGTTANCPYFVDNNDNGLCDYHEAMTAPDTGDTTKTQ